MDGNGSARFGVVAVMSVAMMGAASAAAQEAQRTTGGPPFRRNQLGVEFVTVGNGGGQLRLTEGVGFLLFRGPASAWELHIVADVGGWSQDPPDSIESDRHAVYVAVGQRRYRRVTERAATFRAFGVRAGTSGWKSTQYGVTQENSSTFVGASAGVGATVWATAWLAFGMQYRASADYAWGSTTVTDPFTSVTHKGSSWDVSLDGITVSGSLFF